MVVAGRCSRIGYNVPHKFLENKDERVILFYFVTSCVLRMVHFQVPQYVVIGVVPGFGGSMNLEAVYLLKVGELCGPNKIGYSV